MHALKRLLTDARARTTLRAASPSAVRLTLPIAGSSRPVARAVALFAASGLAALIVLGVLGMLAIRRVAADEALDRARSRAEITGQSVVRPALAGPTSGDEETLARLDGIVRARVLSETVVRVTVSTPRGVVLYSSERRLIGARYPLADAARHALERNGVEASKADLSRPENRFEPRGRGLYDISLPVRPRDGRLLLYDQYVLASAVAADRRELFRELAIPFVVALLLLWAVQLPLAASLARRLQRVQEDREALLLRAAEASQDERRRIAADLHDRVVQDLAGVAFRLEGAARRLPAELSELAEAVRESADGVRASMRRLRSLLVEIYPPRLREAGLEAALADTLAPAAARSVETTLEVEEGLDLDPDVAALVFRTAQEAVRNALAHADARHIDVIVGRPTTRVRLIVADDGQGFDQRQAEARRRDGHLGLSLLGDLAATAGGTLVVDSMPGSGTRVTLEVPDR
jgi:two-component system NarL family sensor kinase